MTQAKVSRVNHFFRPGISLWAVNAWFIDQQPLVEFVGNICTYAAKAGKGAAGLLDIVLEELKTTANLCFQVVFLWVYIDTLSLLRHADGVAEKSTVPGCTTLDTQDKNMEVMGYQKA